MGGGRAPCCDKSQVKRGPWSPAEDLRLITFIQKHGHENWRALPKQAGLLRCGKSCRLRWINYLRPDVKRGNFTPEEEETIIKLHDSLGNKWSKIASRLPGRTDNEIKNVWNTHLKKRLASKVSDSQGEELNEFSMTSSSSSSSSDSFKPYDNQNKGLGLEDPENGASPAKRPKMTLLEEKLNSKTLDSNLTNEAKEPSSCSNSYDSKITDSSQVDVASTPDEELMDSLFNYGGNYEVHDILQEANIEQDILSNKVAELPLESDYDFWNNLENIAPFQSNEAQQLSRDGLVEGSNFGQGCIHQAESMKWLRYLESELGLEATKDESHEYVTTKGRAVVEPLVPETFHNETMLKQEFNLAMAYFQTWPPSPQSFAM
ncbi:hypothetical protein L1049_022258 [Liquidambar formosana]|uniref:Uncharacterized protein n=1 Tax=Liquidambar formosana TaxID=63359 RepID=A0AAP0RCA3_LIQFO